MVQQILSMPQMQAILRSNPEKAAKLEQTIQNNLDPKNIAFVLQTIIKDH